MRYNKYSILIEIYISVDTVSTYAYYPFGDSLSFSVSAGNDLRFGGKLYMARFVAYDFFARYYDPKIGRFYGLDPITKASESPYVYCYNNPLSYSDPYGMNPPGTPPPEGYPPEHWPKVDDYWRHDHYYDANGVLHDKYYLNIGHHGDGFGDAGPGFPGTPSGVAIHPWSPPSFVMPKNPNVPTMRAQPIVQPGSMTSSSIPLRIIRSSLVPLRASLFSMGTKAMVSGSRAVPVVAKNMNVALGITIAAYGFSQATTDRERAQVSWGFSFSTGAGLGLGLIGETYGGPPGAAVGAGTGMLLGYDLGYWSAGALYDIFH